MPAQYLLSCPSCQQPRTIDATQCGLAVDCQCGKKLQVPPMRGLSKLQRVAAAEAPRRSHWGGREGMILAGVVVAAVGLGLGLYGFLTPDDSADTFLDSRVGPKADLSEAGPIQVAEEWSRVLRSGLGEYNPELSTEYETGNRIKHIWTWVALSVGGLGVLMIAGAFVLFAPRG